MDFFIKESGLKESDLYTGSFLNIEKNAILNLNKATEYYNNRVAKVKNDSILVKIINDLYNSESSLLDYIFKIRARKDYVLRNYGIVCNGTKGKVIKDETMINSKEIFIAIDTDLTEELVNSADDNWKTIVPLECTYHCYKDLKFVNPNNKIQYLDSEENVIIYNIDITKLMIMFRYYLENALQMDRGISIPEFIFRYAYANSTQSFLNISLLNRHIDYITKSDFSNISINSKLPEVLLDIEDNVDRYLIQFNKVLKKANKKTYTYLMSNIELISNDALSILSLDNIDINISNLNRWAILIGKLKYILFCLEAFGKDGIKLNKTFITKIRLLFKMYNRENMYVPDEVSNYFYKYLDKINLIIGKSGE